MSRLICMVLVADLIACRLETSYSEAMEWVSCAAAISMV
jgi:hypothetical protein